MDSLVYWIYGLTDEEIKVVEDALMPEDPIDRIIKHPRNLGVVMRPSEIDDMVYG